MKLLSFSQRGVDNSWINDKLGNNKALMVGDVYRQPSKAFAWFQESFCV